jgi:hypothetical protein
MRIAVTNGRELAQALRLKGSKFLSKPFER